MCIHPLGLVRSLRIIRSRGKERWIIKTGVIEAVDGRGSGIGADKGGNPVRKGARQRA